MKLEVQKLNTMNRLSVEKRATMLGMLVEGSSMRSISRVLNVDKDSVARLLEAAGSACAEYHNRNVRKLEGPRRIEIDEIWSYIYAKDFRLKHEKLKNPPPEAGSAWTFTAIDADTKLMISYLVADRDVYGAAIFLQDLCSRLTRPPQITSDGFIPYRECIEKIFGTYVDFTQVIKRFESDRMKVKFGSEDLDNIKNIAEIEGSKYKQLGSKKVNVKKRIMSGNPDLDLATTAHVERMNLSLRMGNRRFARLTNAFSKKIERHIASLNLYYLYHNFCRIHGSLRVTPAMEAGISDTAHDFEWIVELIDSCATPPRRPKHYRKRKKAA